MNEPVSVPLSTPVEAHGETLAVLTLRPPKGRDIRLAGVPYAITQDGDVRIDGAAMAKMIAALAGVPPSVVDGLSSEDWNTAMMAVLGFFGTAPAAS